MQTAQVPELLGGAKISTKSSTLGGGRTNVMYNAACIISALQTKDWLHQVKYED